MKYPSWTYAFDVAHHRDEYIRAIDRVFDSGRLLFGEELKELEKEFSIYIGTNYSIGCDNATNAIFLALKALEIGEGDEVICVPNTAIPTISAIVHSGATPVLVDINKHGLLDVRLAEAAITSRTKAILPVHLYGYPADMEQLKKLATAHNLSIIEDCSQAHGACIGNQKVGALGDISCFSFYPTKPLGALGDAGIICTNNEEIATKLKKLRFYGITSNYVADMDGYNSRMDELQAAVIRSKLKRLDDNISARDGIVYAYKKGFGKLFRQVMPPSYATRVSNYLVPFLVLSDRSELINRLSDVGVGINISYPVPIHLMPAYRELGAGTGTYPVAEFLCSQVFSPPIADYYPIDQINSVIERFSIVSGSIEIQKPLQDSYERLFDA